MVYNLQLTTADDVVAVIDAVNAQGNNATVEFVVLFTGIATTTQASKALDVACDMSMISFDATLNTYRISSPLGHLLSVAVKEDQRAALLRIILEQYEPFNTFKVRFAITQNIDVSCAQIKAIHSIAANERDIKNTIISLGTYAKILKRENATTYSFFTNKDSDHLQLIDELLEEKTKNEILLRQFMGEGIYDYADYNNVIRPLLDATSKAISEPVDTKAVILYAGNAFESFLDQYAITKQISLQGKTGIISKMSAFSSTDISKKHRGQIEYIGQVRNAADHGADILEANMTWGITKETATVYPIIVSLAIKNIIQRDQGIIEM